MAEKYYSSITQEELKKVLNYDPDTGVFTRVDSGVVVGYKVGSKGRFYLGTEIAKKQYKLHRLAWLFYYGEHPKNLIDHIDGDGFNNRIKNLRDVSNSENAQNLKKATRQNKSTGLLGVYYRPDRGTFRAKITLNGKTKSLGYFKTAIEAHNAYLNEKRKIHSACTI